jgi:hypothetical protein
MSSDTLSPKQMDAADAMAEADTQAAIDRMRNEEKLVTVVHARSASIECPHCGATVAGYSGDPRGVADTCDSCKKPFRVSPDADVVIN